jgi:hypothetical protein
MAFSGSIESGPSENFTRHTVKVCPRCRLQHNLLKFKPLRDLDQPGTARTGFLPAPKMVATCPTYKQPIIRIAEGEYV